MKEVAKGAYMAPILQMGTMRLRDIKNLLGVLDF